MPKFRTFIGIVTLITLSLGLLSYAVWQETQTTHDIVKTPAPAITFAYDPNDIPVPLPGNLDEVTIVEDGREYVIRQIIPTDGIRPVYNPQFTTADKSEYDAAELVMGVEINGDARAYSVGFLRSREMVNDEVGGTPILVTW